MSDEPRFTCINCGDNPPIDDAAHVSLSCRRGVCRRCEGRMLDDHPPVPTAVEREVADVLQGIASWTLD